MRFCHCCRFDVAVLTVPHVRRLVGYRRLEGLAAVGVLGLLYEVARLFVNFFQPAFKLASNTRVGARVTKR